MKYFIQNRFKILLFLMIVASLKAQVQLPRDANGFTHIEQIIANPPVGARIIYVSSSTGNDANNGLSPNTPKQTAASGINLLRNGMPDIILFKRGDTWTDQTLGGIKSGQSATAPIIYSYYGDLSLPRPLFKTGNSTFASVSGTNNFHAIIGLEAYAHTRNPQTSEFITAHTASWSSGYGATCQGTDYLIEDCKFSFYAQNIIVQIAPGVPVGGVSNVVIRRCISTNAYSTTMHGLGIYTFSINGLLIEENVFDENGYNEAGGDPKSFFSHNMYLSGNRLSDGGDNVVVRGNLVLRAPANGIQCRPGGIVENNLIAQCGIALFTGRYRPTLIKNNVVTDPVDISSNPADHRAWGITIKRSVGAIVEGNILTKKILNRQSFAFEVPYSTNPDEYETDVAASKITFRNNITYKWNGTSLSMLSIPTSLINDTIISENNSFQEYSGGEGKMISYAPFPINPSFSTVPPGYVFRNNRYSSPLTSPFSHMGTTYNLANWQMLKSNTNDAGSSMVQVQYADPERDILSYQTYIGGAATFEAYAAEARLQRRGYWRTAYTADAINDYIRAGFCEGSIPQANFTYAVSGTTLNTTNTSTGNNNTYTWDFADNTTSTQASPSHTYAVNGLYSVTLTATNNCGANSYITSVNINSCSSPTVTIAGNRNICSGKNTTLSAGGASFYQWNNGSTSSSITVSPTNTTSYFVLGTVSTCTSIATATVTVAATPTVTISGTTSTCSGSSILLTASGANSYSWVGTSVTTSSFSLIPTISSTYTLIGTTNACSANSEILVTVYELPEITISGNNTICIGDSTELTAEGAFSYVWAHSSEGIIASTTIVSPLVETVYTVEGLGVNGCLGEQQITVYVNPLPDTYISLIGNDSLSVSPTSEFYQWVHCPEYEMISGANENNFIVSQNGNYAVIVGNNYGCIDTSDCLTVDVNNITSSVTNNNASNYNLIKCYPNPTGGKFTIDFAMQVPAIEVIVMNVLGQEITTKQYQNTSLIKTEIEGEKGIYLLKVIFDNDNNKNLKIIKQ